MASDKAGPLLLGSTPLGSVAGSGVSMGKADPAFVSRPHPGSGVLALRVTDPTAASRARKKADLAGGSSPRTGEAAPAEGGDFSCLEHVDTLLGSVGEDDFLEETVHLDYLGELDCNFYLASISGVAGVLDRSEAFNGESFDGRVLGTGTPIFAEWDYQGFSVGSIDVRARDYNGGRRVEAAIELYLEAPEGLIWDACNPVPGLRYLACDGLGTDLLHVALGTGPFGTGMTRACRDQRAPLDNEQNRLRLPPGSTPASTQILRRINEIKVLVTSFKRDLCGTSLADGGDFADVRGGRLWDEAVRLAKLGAAAGDDRPLYWARLSMTAALSQWRPPGWNEITLARLQTDLDRAARGINSADFSSLPVKKIFVSGFDPFELDGSGIVNGNPSGAAALRLDGSVTSGGAQIQAVIFPVRYADFDAGIVEQVFLRHLVPGSQQATFITTVSQQEDQQFDLEVYNGRSRASLSNTAPSLDNRNAPPTGAIVNPNPNGTYNAPFVPAELENSPEFIATSLPVHNMRVPGAYPVVINTVVHEQSPRGSASRQSDDGPTAGSRAVQGSGGGFLSNEVAYRVTRLRDGLRDELGVVVPAGHIHVPKQLGGAAFDSSRNAIVNQYIAILAAVNPIDSPAVFVRQQYVDFVNREPDAGGLAFWTDQITRCGWRDTACISAKRIDVSRAFWYSSEFLAQHPGLLNPPGSTTTFNNAEFIRLSYVSYLRREPDPGGLNFWLNELNRDNDYNHIIDAFLNSVEYRARFA
jgi:hypothetical protein